MLAPMFIRFAHVNDGCFACLHTARSVAGSDGGGASSSFCGWNGGASSHGVYEPSHGSMVPGNVGIATLENSSAGIVRRAGNLMKLMGRTGRMNRDLINLKNPLRAGHAAGSIRLPHGSHIRTTGRSTAGDRGACDSLRAHVARGGLALDA